MANYLSHLSAVFKVAGPAWNYPLDELDKLMAHFLDGSIRRPSSVPMHRVIAFAIFSTRRQ